MNSQISSRGRRVFLAAASGIALSAASLRATAEERRTLKMVTSWPKNSPGPGITAQRLANRITALSSGRLEIKVYAAGEIVGPLEVLDAVREGVADFGHTASFFWQGKMPASAFFTAVPFGLTAGEHEAWIYHGGGQALWDELYAAFAVKPFLAGNTGMSMGGWFRREIDDVRALQGLKYRIPGLGGEVLRRLGGVPVSVPPGEIFSALQTGVLDGAEFLGPWSDLAFGFYKVAKYYYWPGWHEPNGAGECLINLDVWSGLAPELQEVVTTACAAEASFARAETEWRNAEALAVLVHQHDVNVRQFPSGLLVAAREATEEVMTEFMDGSDLEHRIYSSYENARGRANRWSDISLGAYLRTRVGT